MPDNELQPEERAGVRKFLRLPRQRRYLLIGGAALACLVVFAAAAILIINRPAAAPAAAEEDEAPATAEPATVLPQIKREGEQNPEIEIITRDPFASPLKLTGIVTGGAGGSMAIVESGGTAYIVAAGEMIAKYWSVQEITDDTVFLTSADGEVVLRIQHRVVEGLPGDEAEEVAR